MLTMKESETKRRKQERKGALAWGIVIIAVVGISVWDCSRQKEESPKPQAVAPPQPCDCADEIKNLEQQITVLKAKLKDTVSDLDECITREVEYVLKVKH